LIGEDKYKELLQIKPSHSLVFVIDQSGSMAAVLPIIAQESKAIIQNASASSNALRMAKHHNLNPRNIY
jgi:hypothetical protein